VRSSIERMEVTIYQMKASKVMKVGRRREVLVGNRRHKKRKRVERMVVVVRPVQGVARK